jgi:hypothetical protein
MKGELTLAARLPELTIIAGLFASFQMETASMTPSRLGPGGHGSGAAIEPQEI